jgi:hypothetical protein
VLDPNCSIARSLGVLGERWTFLILREAMDGTTRFADAELVLRDQDRYRGARPARGGRRGRASTMPPRRRFFPRWNTC